MKELFPKEVNDIYLTLKKAILKSPGTYLAFGLLIVSVLLTTVVSQKQQELRQRAQSVTTFTPVSVNIVDFQFSQATVTVQVGSPVTWTNRSTNGVPHTTTSDVQGNSNSWNSGTLNPGQSFTKTFTQAGTFEYHCEIHGKAVMSGRVIVVAANQPTSTLFPTTAITRAPTATNTPRVTPGVSIQPTSAGGDDEPPYVCLGSCPTKTPTPTMSPYPTLTPTRVPYAPSPTPTKPYAPTVAPTAAPYAPTATIAPCSTDNSSLASDNGYSDNSKKNKNKGGNQNFIARFFEFFINIFLKLLEVLFGFRTAPPQPVVVPTPAVLPTAAAVTGLPNPLYTSLTPRPSVPMPQDTPMYRVYDPNQTPAPTTKPGYPTNTPQPYVTQPYVTPCPPTSTPPYQAPSPTNTPYNPPTTYAPSVAPSIISYVSPTLGTILSPTYGAVTPSVLPTATTQPSTSVSPTPFGRSVASIVYVPGNEPLKTYDITAAVNEDKWLFNGMQPGPEIKATQGDHLRINVHNQLPEPLSVHWHGIKLPSSQDGVPGITQDAIQPGNTLTYDYVVPDAGTYWYHSHQNGTEQVPKGLFGSLVVEPKQQNTHYDREYYITYRNTDPITQHFDANPGETVHVRILNARSGDFAGTPLRIVPVGVPYKVVAMDGQDLQGPQDIQSASTLFEIGFAQRYDFSFTMPASGAAMIADSENLQTIQFGSGITTPPDGLGSLPVFDWTAYGTPGPDTYIPKTWSTPDMQQTLTIGANLSINGKLGHEIPDMILPNNKVVMIRYENNSNMTHPMHLHGHFYTVLKKNDKPLTGSQVHLDTILLHPGETADLAFYTDDPGVWMLHCHVLPHAAAGLSMVARYEDVYNPYQVGGPAGNRPE